MPPWLQLVFALIVTLTMAVALLKLQPFVSNSDDKVSTMSHWVQFVQVFAGLLTKIQADQACNPDDAGSFDTNALAYVARFALSQSPDCTTETQS